MALSSAGVLRNFTAKDFSVATGDGEEGGTAPGSPRVTAITPNTAEIGAPDLLVTVTGGGFTAESVIVWNGGDEPTTFVSKSALTTTVKPSTASGEFTIPVTVRTGELTAAGSVDFSFIAPSVPEGTSEEIITWVNNDANRATIALEAEEADPEPRAELVSQLEALINADSKPKPKPRPTVRKGS